MRYDGDGVHGVLSFTPDFVARVDLVSSFWKAAITCVLLEVATSLVRWLISQDMTWEMNMIVAIDFERYAAQR